MTNAAEPESGGAVAWKAPAAPDPTERTAGQRVLEVLAWIIALALLVMLATIRADRRPDLGPSERLGYIAGGVLASLLVATGIRWLWLRFRRRGDPTARLLSPWIPFGAILFPLAALVSGTR